MSKLSEYFNFPLISQEGGGGKCNKRRRRVAFVTRGGKKVLFTVKNKRRRRRPTNRGGRRRRRNQKGKGFVADYLDKELRDVGGQVARSVVSKGVNEAQSLLRKGARFFKNKLMRRRRQRTPAAASTVGSTVPMWED